MTAGPNTRPKRGDIFTYCYLFTHEADKGIVEGRKDRPIMVIAVDGDDYLVAAITTKGERNPNAIAIPSEVAAITKLDPGSAIVVSELNNFTWPGYDIRPLAKQTSYVTGTMPPRFFAHILGQIGKRTARIIDRD